MARKKDLGGLAALAGLAYMASRDKAASGDVPVEDRVGKPVTGDDQYNPDVKYGDFMSEKEPGWESGTAPTAPARTTRVAAKPKDVGDDSYNPAVKQRLRDDQYNPDVKQRTASKLSILEEAKEEARRRRAGAEAASPKREAPGRFAGKGPGLGALSGMKKGGSVKGWGAARGARKAKIY